MAVRALWYRGGILSLIDQRALPQRTRVLRLRHLSEVAEAIRTLTVRGAPAIGVAAAYGMLLAQREGKLGPEAAARVLRATRPTAVDLFVGVEAVRSVWAAGGDVARAAEDYRARIVEECHRIGVSGAPLFRRTRRVLTHCNAGALATVEWGTALAPLRVARAAGAHLFVWVDETRPLLQGSRLTAWELARERIPHAVIADNAAGHYLATGQVDASVDLVARTGSPGTATSRTRSVPTRRRSRRTRTACRSTSRPPGARSTPAARTDARSRSRNVPRRRCSRSPAGGPRPSIATPAIPPSTSRRPGT